MQPGQPVECSFNVAHDLECVGCGYNLKSLPSNSVCPECGRPVAQTVYPVAFRFTSWSAIRWVRRGLMVWVLSFLVWAAGLIFCTARVSCSGDLRLSARWSLYAVVMDDLAWITESVAVICFSRGIAIQWRGRRRAIVVVVALIAAASCLLDLNYVAFIFYGRGVPSSIISTSVELCAEFGRPLASAAAWLLLALAIRPPRGWLILPALIAMAITCAWPLIGGAINIVRSLLTCDPDLLRLGWTFWAEDKQSLARSYMWMTVAILLTDRALRGGTKQSILTG
ncbi:MAG TPA: hypothetical protein VJZ71_03475 [Phycisphaerae bacterium]|nr:hypothetical protein [Phycisphaerae bacterium]